MISLQLVKSRCLSPAKQVLEFARDLSTSSVMVSDINVFRSFVKLSWLLVDFCPDESVLQIFSFG